jgi:hypothetical protein
VMLPERSASTGPNAFATSRSTSRAVVGSVILAPD